VFDVLDSVAVQEHSFGAMCCFSPSAMLLPIANCKLLASNNKAELRHKHIDSLTNKGLEGSGDLQTI